MKILDGKVIRDEILACLKNEFAKLAGVTKLAIIQVGDRQDSDSYIRQKKIFAEKAGAAVELFRFPENCSAKEVLDKIRVLNTDTKIHGIIVQLPLPANFSPEEIIDAIEPKKDVDGLTSTNLRRLVERKLDGLVPATAQGVLRILDYYQIPVAGKKVAVVGQSFLVGRPVNLVLLARGAEVSVCRSQTKNIPAITKAADIVVTAIGRPKFFGKGYFSASQTVIDVGINKSDNGLVGDVDFEVVKDVVEAITPVPGGVGPMTVACLFENLLKARIISE